MSSSKLKSKLHELIIVGIVLFILALASLIVVVAYKPLVSLILIAITLTGSGLFFLIIGVREIKGRKKDLQ